MAIFTSVLTGGANNHETTAEEVNALATDFVTAGVIGTITDTSGVAPLTGAYAVNAQGTPDMTVAVTAGVAYVTGTPTGQNSQTMRVRMTASQNVAIAANSSGSTKYDWIYLSIDPDNAADPALAGDDVVTLVTSRSTSTSSDDGTPPTYGLVIAKVTVANGASSITNGNIAEARILAVNAQDGSIGEDEIAAKAVTPAKLSDSFSFGKATYSTYGSSGGQVIGTSVATFAFDTFNAQGTTGITHSSGLLSVAEAGWYIATFNASISDGASSTFRLQLAPTDTSGTALTGLRYTTEVTAINNRNTYTITRILYLAANEGVKALGVCSGNIRFSALQASSTEDMSLTLMRFR